MLNWFYEFVTHHEAVATLVLGFLGVASYLYTRKHDRTLAKHQNYLSLEFESIRVFQTCLEHPEIPLYLEGETVAEPLSQYIAEKAYWLVCQELNLFELIISYRKDEVVPDDVFATWVSWFHELGTAERFQDIWIKEELWSHYKEELRNIMETAIALTGKRGKDFNSVPTSYDDELQEFHEAVGRIMDDDSIAQHFRSARQKRRRVVDPTLGIVGGLP